MEQNVALLSLVVSSFGLIVAGISFVVILKQLKLNDDQVRLSQAQIALNQNQLELQTREIEKRASLSLAVRKAERYLAADASNESLTFTIRNDGDRAAHNVFLTLFVEKSAVSFTCNLGESVLEQITSQSILDQWPDNFTCVLTSRVVFMGNVGSIGVGQERHGSITLSGFEGEGPWQKPFYWAVNWDGGRAPDSPTMAGKEMLAIYREGSNDAVD